MRQVPVQSSKDFSSSSKPIGIVGNGLLASHFLHYFQLLSIPFVHWHRSQNTKLDQVLQNCEIVWVLISDSAIEEFIQHHQDFFKSRVALHASGSLQTSLAYGYHPLMTFSRDLYEAEFYKTIPFIGTCGEPPLKQWIPTMPNSFFQISSQLKGRYHAHCVMSNNFTTILWQNFFSFIQTELGLPKQLADAYLERTLLNLKGANYEQALTGPLKRKDVKTIERNINSLQKDHEKNIYRDFVMLSDTQLGEQIGGKS